MEFNGLGCGDSFYIPILYEIIYLVPVAVAERRSSEAYFSSFTIIMEVWNCILSGVRGGRLEMGSAAVAVAINAETV